MLIDWVVGMGDFLVACIKFIGEWIWFKKAQGSLF